MADDDFDPYKLLEALERRRVTYVIVGGVGRVLHGSDELTGGLDIVPSTKDENLRRLGFALRDLGARRSDGGALAPEADFGHPAILELQTNAGELKIVSAPAGTRGYDDLRRRARREPLGRGLRPSVASIDDHARMLAALDRQHDEVALQTVRRLIELERELHRGLSIER